MRHREVSRQKRLSNLQLAMSVQICAFYQNQLGQLMLMIQKDAPGENKCDVLTLIRDESASQQPHGCLSEVGAQSILSAVFLVMWCEVLPPSMFHSRGPSG